MIYRVTFGFSGRGQGWAETHALISGFNNPVLLAPICIEVAQKRVQMLGTEFEINAIRIARYSTDGGARIRGSYVLKRSFRIQSTAGNIGAEPASVALHVRGSATPSVVNPQFDANMNQSFLGAPLDLSVDDGGIVYEGRGNLGTAFAQWRSLMVGNEFGWLADQTILLAPITTITQTQGSGTVTLTVPTAIPPTVTVGQYYEARISAVNNGRSPLNMQLVVFVGAGGVLTTRRVIGIPTDQVGGQIRIYKQVKPFVDYGDIVLESTVARHKRGRPFGSSPGRAKSRILG